MKSSQKEGEMKQKGSLIRYYTKYSKAMSEFEIKETREKILKGLTIAFQRLVEQKKKSGEELVFSQDGKIVRIKAGEIDVFGASL